LNMGFVFWTWTEAGEI